MSTLISNSFSTYELTDKEALQSAIFTTLQLQNLQNQLANAAEEKLRLDFDPNNPSRFIQQEASLRGQMDILTFLIEASESAADQLANPELYTPEV